MKRIICLIAAVIGIGLLTGCASQTITEYDAATGKIVKTTKSNTPLTMDKTIAVGGGFSAISVESTGSESSGTPTANIKIGGGAGGMVSSPKDDPRPAFNMSWSSGILNSLTHSSATSGDIQYVGEPNETAADTVARIQAALAAKAAIGNSSSDSASKK